MARPSSPTSTATMRHCRPESGSRWQTAGRSSAPDPAAVGTTVSQAVDSRPRSPVRAPTTTNIHPTTTTSTADARSSPAANSSSRSGGRVDWSLVLRVMPLGGDGEFADLGLMQAGAGLTTVRVRQMVAAWCTYWSRTMLSETWETPSSDSRVAGTGRAAQRSATGSPRAGSSAGPASTDIRGSGSGPRRRCGAAGWAGRAGHRLAGCVGVNRPCCTRASPASVASSARAWGCRW
jgi:hypothetical protein